MPTDHRADAPGFVLDTPASRRVVDGLRALGILAVILFHTLFGLGKLAPDGAFDAYAAGMPRWLNFGWQALGSEVVFLLSGFLLAYHLLKRRAEGRPVSAREHVVRRLSRILPLYLVALALYGLRDDYTLRDWALNLVFLSELGGAETILPVGWSLELLMQAYLVLPLATRALARARRPLAWLGAALALSVATRAVALLVDPAVLDARVPDFLAGRGGPEVFAALYYRLWYRATPFVLGLAAAWLCVTHGAALRRALAAPSRGAALMLAGAALVVASSALPLHDAAAPLHAESGRGFWLAFWSLQRLVFGAGCAALLLGALFARGRLADLLRAPLVWRGWEPVARGIYSIYLFHVPCLLPAAALVFFTIDPDTITHVGVGHVLSVATLGALLSIGLARVLTRWVELPAQRFLRARAWGRQRTGVEEGWETSKERRVRVPSV